jgi:engulfment/cell motility protein 1
MSSHNIDDLTSSILDFQANIVRVTYRKKSTLVEPEVEPLHESALEYIWNCSKVEEGRDNDGEVLKWRKLGFSSENLVHEFQEVGELGLDCLVSTVISPYGPRPIVSQRNFVADDPDLFSKVSFLYSHSLSQTPTSISSAGHIGTVEPSCRQAMPHRKGLE